MLISRQRLLRLLSLGLVIATVGCGRLPQPGMPSPTPQPTATAAPPPAWEDRDTYRVAMIASAADDVNKVEMPTFYHIQARLDLSQATPRIHAVQTTRYTNKANVTLDAVYFRLFPNKPGYGSELSFRSVTVQGQEAKLDYQSERTAVGVALAEPLPPGQPINVEMEYDVTVPVSNTCGYGTFNDQDGVLLLSNYSPMVAVYDPSGWNLALAPDYGDPVYAETSFYDVEFTAPQGMTVVASGSTTARHDNGDGTTTWTLLSGPMRDMMVVVSDRFESSSYAVGYIRVNSYYLPQDKQVGLAVLDDCRDALRAYQQSFGPYPFAEFDVVEAPIYAGGMEYPGLIMVANRQYQAGGEYLEFVTAHEVAHQWWYSLVGNDQVLVPWLDESLANFSTLYYFEYVYGSDRANMAFQNYVASQYYRAKEEGRDGVVNQPVEAFSPEQYGVIVYGKGAVFFYELRAKLGDSLFLDMLRAYLQDREYKVARPDDLLRVADEVSGQKLDDFYAQWILQ
jgi:aminopeptidase N